MLNTIKIAADRAYDDKTGVIPREMARGVYIENAPGAQATKALHLMIDHAAGRMADDCWHEVHLRDIRKMPGMRNHDLASLREVIHEIATSTFSFEVDIDQRRRKVGIGTFLDGGELVYHRLDEGDLVVRWHFGVTFRTLAQESNHWAILDRQAFFSMRSKYSLALFQQISSRVRLEHVTSHTYSVAELRQVMGVGAGKMAKWNDLNRFTLKPALAELNQLTRFNVSADFIKAGRRIDKVKISWEPKADPTEVKAELDRPKTGRKARRDGTAETPIAAFPASGGIRYAEPWQTIAKTHGSGKDINLIAGAFRDWCAGKNIPLDGPKVERQFETFCKGVNL